MSKRKLAVITSICLISTLLTACKKEPIYSPSETEPTLPVTTSQVEIEEEPDAEIPEVKNYYLTDKEYIESLRYTADYINNISSVMLDIHDNGENNVMISGFSAHSAMSRLANYATGETAEQFETVLGKTDIAALDYFKNNMPIETSSIFLIDDQLKLNTPDVSTFVFKDLQADSIVPFVNDLAADMTHNMITSLIDEPFKNSTVAAIIDGIYFKGGWEHEFDKDLTNKQTFHGSIKDSDVDFMCTTNEFKINSDYNIISLDYKNSNLTMDICYDLDGKSASEAFKTYVENINEISNNAVTKQVDLTMPKFETECEINITNDYKSCGIIRPFDPQCSADLSNLADNLFISDAKQKTKIIVDEKGTEASALTIIIVDKADCIAPEIENISITIDKPFTYAIREKSTNIILFAGYIYNFE